MKNYDLVVIEGDGIGKELTAAAILVLKETEKILNTFQFTLFKYCS